MMSLLFTPASGIIGGSLIGASTSVLLWLNGDILGLSGVISTTGLSPIQSTKSVASHWKLTFLASFAITANLWANYYTDTNNDNYAGIPTRSILAHIVGGFLVGVGTKLGNGCTTGHGICGMARYSLRSLIAVCTFTGSAIATAVLTSHNVPWSETTQILRLGGDVGESLTLRPLGSAVVAVLVFLSLIRYSDVNDKVSVDDIKAYLRKTIGGTISGAMISIGLAVSGMTKVHKVLGFLDFHELSISGGKHYDPTLVTVLCSAIFAGWVGYKLVDGHAMVGNACLKKPVCAPTWSIPNNSTIDRKLIVGATLFGLGWGIAGLCPGPALYQAATGNVYVALAWIPTFLTGSYVGQILKDQMDQSGATKKAI